MAIAFREQGLANRHAVAIIGDGALTAGMAFEGLNNLAAMQANMLVIVNDNNMAIDPNVGGFSEYLTDIATSKTYNNIREEVIKGLGRLKIGGQRAKEIILKVNNSIKTLMSRQTNFFEGMNIRYFGPVDGHDLSRLTTVLADLKEIKGPKILHVITKKGKGFKHAETNQTAWHAPGNKFDKHTGAFIDKQPESPQPLRFQDIFGNTIIELAKLNPKIVGVTPAMPTGCGLNKMMELMPGRAFDVGIAEQHAVTFSAGMAISGLLPFCNIYSSFMQRAYDQVLHDVAIQNLNVVFCLDRGGLSGPDGVTHHGVFDIAYMRAIPNMIVSSPMDEVELRNLMYTAQLPNMGPFSIRYPRGNGSRVDWEKPFEQIAVGTGRKLRDGNRLAFLTIGPIGVKVERVCEQLEKLHIEAAHYDMRFAKPIDENILHEVFTKFDRVITIEEGTIIGGMGSAVVEFMATHGYSCRVVRLGIPDKFVDHGTQVDLYREVGINMSNIKSVALELVGVEVV